jgi:hypothetical protein
VNQNQWIAIGRVLGMWTLFGVVFALVPIIFSGLSEWIHGDSIGLDELISRRSASLQGRIAVAARVLVPMTKLGRPGLFPLNPASTVGVSPRAHPFA